MIRHSGKFFTRFMAALAAALSVAGAAGTARADKIYVSNSAAAGDIQMINPATNTNTVVVPGIETCRNLVMFYGSPYLYASEGGAGINTIAVIDTRTNQLFTRITTSITDILHMVITQDGKWIFASSNVFGAISVIDARRFIEVAVLDPRPQVVIADPTATAAAAFVASLALDPSSRTLYVTCLATDGLTLNTLHAIRIPLKGNPFVLTQGFPRALPGATLATAVVVQSVCNGRFVYSADLFTGLAASANVFVFDLRRQIYTTIDLPETAVDATFGTDMCLGPGGNRLFVAQPGLTQVQVINAQRNVPAKVMLWTAAAGGPAVAPHVLVYHPGAQHAWGLSIGGAGVVRWSEGNLGFPFCDANLDGISPDVVAQTGTPLALCIKRENYGKGGKGALPAPQTDTRMASLVPGFEAIDALGSILTPPEGGVADEETPSAPAGSGAGLLFAGTVALAMAGLALTRLGRVA